MWVHCWTNVSSCWAWFLLWKEGPLCGSLPWLSLLQSLLGSWTGIPEAAGPYLLPGQLALHVYLPSLDVVLAQAQAGGGVCSSAVPHHREVKHAAGLELVDGALQEVPAYSQL